jgi:protein ImuA
MEPARSKRAEGFRVPANATEGRHLTAIAALRHHIARFEQPLPQFNKRPARDQPWTLGIPIIDAHLAAFGLARTGLHDVAPQAYGDMPAAMGFALALGLRHLADMSERRPLLWCRLAREEHEYGRLYGHGLETLGLARNRFLTLTLKRPAALLWTMEDALKSGALALVISDADSRHANLTVTRRLSLAAHAGESAGLLVFSKPHVNATASHTRWITATTKSRAPPYDIQAPGHPAWEIELTRARGGRPGAWTVEWHHAPHCFNLVSKLSRGALHPWADESGKIFAAQSPALRAG